MTKLQISFNGSVEVRLVPESEEDVALLKLAFKDRQVIEVKDGLQESKVLVLGKKES